MRNSYSSVQKRQGNIYVNIYFTAEYKDLDIRYVHSKEIQSWIPIFTADILARLACRGGINKSGTIPFGWSRSWLQIIVPADTWWRKTGSPTTDTGA